MMSIKGLQPGEMVLPKTFLKAGASVYFSSIVLSMWDNIHGPKVLQVWQGPGQLQGKLKQPPEPDKEPERVNNLAQGPADEKLGLATDVLEETLTSESAVKDSILLSVANYSLNDEAARTESIKGIESKFYSLPRFNIIAFASIFTIEITKTKTEVFSFVLVLPYSETSEFLSRYKLCEVGVQKLLQDWFIRPLNDLQSSNLRRPINANVQEVLKGFDPPLLKFTQTMWSVKHNSLPDKIKIANTHLGKDSVRQDMKHFLTLAVTSHIQTSGYTIVLGSDRAAVNKMILTLGMFLSSKERKMSRLVCKDLEDDKAGYEPHLFLQGYVMSRDPQLPFSRNDLYLNKLPPTLIHLDCREVRVFEPKINYFVWMKEDQPEPAERRPAKSDLPLVLKDFKELDKADLVSRLVQDFLSNLWLLNTVGGLRETFIAQFLRLVKLKALALAKYLDTESKSPAIPDITDLVALKANTGDKRKVNLAALQQDLAIESFGDLHVVLAFTEKIRPRTYYDVHGDPQLDNLAVINEFASL